MILLDALSYTSKLRAIDPRAKIAFAMVGLSLCLGFSHIAFSLVTIALFSVLSLSFSGVSLKSYASLLLLPLSFLLLGTVGILFSPQKGDYLWAFPLFGQMYGINMADLYFGMGLILKALGAASCMYFLVLTTPMTDLLTALRRFGIPLILVSLMELIYRYLFLILEEALCMKTAQAARLGYESFGRSLRSAGVLLGVLFVRVLEKGDRIYEGLASRGYEGKPVALEKDYILPAPLLGAGLGVLAALTAFGLYIRLNF